MSAHTYTGSDKENVSTHSQLSLLGEKGGGLRVGDKPVPEPHIIVLTLNSQFKKILLR